MLMHLDSRAHKKLITDVKINKNMIKTNILFMLTLVPVI